MKIVLLATLVAISGAQSCGPGGSYSIDGSTDVIPIAEAWKSLVETICPDHNITIVSSDSNEAASRICDDSSSQRPIEIGAMTRDFAVSEASVSNNGWLYSCQGSARKVIQVAVAYDSISFAVLKDSAADKCIQSLVKGGGLNLDQLRWIFSNFSEEELISTGWQSNSIDNSFNDTRRTWKRLGGSKNELCPDEEIFLAGSALDSISAQFFQSILLTAKGEDVATTRAGGFFSSLDEQEMANYLMNNSNAISFFGDAQIIPLNQQNLSMIKIKNPLTKEYVDPTSEYIYTKDYTPFSRYIYMNVANTDQIKELVNPFFSIGFNLTNENAVRNTGRVPLSLRERTVMLTRLQAEGGVVREDINCGTYPSGGVIDIAGSSTVYPVADLWAGVYLVFCRGIEINVEGGGSSVGARRVCDQSSEGDLPVDIGDMSREWKIPKEVTSDDGWIYKCAESASARSVKQIPVAIDGLSVVTSNKGNAYNCIKILGGLTIDQLRWIYSDLSVDSLVQDNWSKDSVPFLDGDDRTHLWSELSDKCAPAEIRISGADNLSGTYAYFSEVLFKVVGESFDLSRPSNPPYFNSPFDEEVLQYVKDNEDAIGYFGYSYVAQNEDTLSSVPIMNPEGVYVVPEPKTVEGGEYQPLSRRLYMNLWDDPESLSHTLPFMNFGMSETGRRLVDLTGYSPIPLWEEYLMRTRVQAGSGFPLEDIRAAAGGCGQASSAVIPATDAGYKGTQAWIAIYDFACPGNMTVERTDSNTIAQSFCDESQAPVFMAVTNQTWPSNLAVPAGPDSLYKCVSGSRQIIQLPVAVASQPINQTIYLTLLNDAAALAVALPLARLVMSAIGDELAVATDLTPLSHAAEIAATNAIVQTNNESTDSSSGLSVGAIVGIAVGGAAVLVTCLLFVLLRRKKRIPKEIGRPNENERSSIRK